VKQRRRAPDYRGIDNDYATLGDVLPGHPDYYRWVEAGSLMRRTQENMAHTGIEFDFDLRARGCEVFAPDMSMFTLGGGGVHSPCQALKRDKGE